MKKHFIRVLISLFLISGWMTGTAQNSTLQLSPLSKAEQKKLRKLPRLQLPEQYRNKNLPAVVDNSTQPYMREAFQQSGLCCGQAAGVAYNYTYEIDRLRDLPADINDNLYPTHFTWNWMHGGYGWYGVSYLHSFQVLRWCGNVNVTDYGGSLAAGGADRWMSGYDSYYNGMSNRISSVYQINVGTPEGLDIFKHWINDHLDGSDVGGVGSFYSQYMSATNTLPAGTPEAGKYVLTSFGGSANHAQTIVGYNDSIRWDYNNDGQYTNDIDINGDGEVDMKDWEIGGFKMVQSYGGVPGWGDQGYAYMMYKTVADELGQGGIWNHCVHVLYAKEDVDPQATMKVSLKHDSRDKLKVVAGLSNNVGSAAPEYIMEFPIFNYQGGDQFMQGGWSNPDNRTIEFGLDISPLLSVANLNQDVKFFLQVYEYDPSAAGAGQIISFSVIDYTNGMQEYPCSQSWVDINHNDLTTLSLTANLNFDRVHIDNQLLPPAVVGQAFNHQLTASGGHPPYSYHLVKLYDEDISSESFPMVSQEQLNPGSNNSGFVTKALDFDFPFYDSVYSSLSVHVDGYLMFDEQLFPYPYFYDDLNLFRITRHISPFMCHAIRLYTQSGDGLWYEGDTASATFRWNASIDGYSGVTDLNFAVRLFPSGEMQFFYDNILIDDDVLWVPGFSDGNEYDQQFSSFYFEDLPAPGSKYTYTPYDYPEGISISEDGLISGTVQQTSNADEMTFRVTDNNFVYNDKTLIFSTSLITVQDSISSGGDDLIEYGEIVSQTITVTNLGNTEVTDAEISLEINDPLVTIFDDYEYIGTIGPYQSIELINAFSFRVHSNVPDEYLLEMETSIEGSSQVWESSLSHMAYAPVISLEEVIIDDGNNGLLDPGETTDILCLLKNTGGAGVGDFSALISCQDPLVEITLDSAFAPEFEPDSVLALLYTISLDAQAEIGEVLPFMMNMHGEREFEDELVFDLSVGLTTEDFETGDFLLFNWGFLGDRDWIIDNTNPYEGEYFARSGNITHEQQSSMILDIEILTAGDIRFFRRVSCEDDVNDNYDYLSFLIDDVEQARWDSILSWEEVSFPVDAGFHRFEWRYTKDESQSEGLDAAFIDYIQLPSCSDPVSQVIPGLTAIEKEMIPDDIDQDTLLLSNPGQGEVEYSIIITSTTKDNSNRSIEGSYLECAESEFFAGENFDWDFTLFNNSSDDEWLQNLSIQFPEGIIVQSTSHFSGGSGGDLIFSGSFGNGALTNWYGEDASGWGVVHGGEFAYGSVAGYVEPDFSEDAELAYVITGDIYGAEPHIVEGSILLSNLGGNVAWLSCDVYQGTIPGGNEQEIILTFNTEAMDDGDYYCNIVLRDNFQHENIIPVHLRVDTYLGSDGHIVGKTGIRAFPNPFSHETTIMVNNSLEEIMSIRILDARGQERAVLAENLSIPAGQHQFTWDDNCPAGLYFVVLKSSEGSQVIKLIKTN